MDYILYRDKWGEEREILSVHSTLVEAIEEQRVYEYEDTFKERLGVLNAYIENKAFHQGESSFGIHECKKPDHQWSYDERKQRIAESYEAQIKAAQEAHDKKYKEALWNLCIQREKHYEATLQKIKSLVEDYDTCATVLEKDAVVNRLKPLVRDYLMHHDDPELLNWMRDRFIV